MVDRIPDETYVKMRQLLKSMKKPVSISFIRDETTSHPKTIKKVLKQWILQNQVRKIITSGGTYYEWNETAVLCDKCKKPMRLINRGVWQCTNKDCGYIKETSEFKYG